MNTPSVSNPFDDEHARFLILKNSLGQFSLWPEYLRIPLGWDVVLESATRDVCHQYLAQNWPDVTAIG